MGKGGREGGARGGCLRGNILEQPIVLVAANSKVIIVGEVNHVSRSRIHRVPQRVVRSAPVGRNTGRVASNVGLELRSVSYTRGEVSKQLRLQLVVAVVH